MKLLWMLATVLGVSGCMQQGGMWGQAAALPPAPANRHIKLNGHRATANDLQILDQLETRAGQRLPDGDYWYDTVSGAAGRWGGPTQAFLPAGLGLGGKLPAHASGGGTGVYINGRELHPQDAMGLYHYTGVAPQRGRYWVDAQGNFGYEGGPMLGNIHAAARMRGGGGGNTAWSKRVDMLTGNSADNLNMASDGQTSCVSVGDYSRCYGPGAP